MDVARAVQLGSEPRFPAHNFTSFCHRLRRLRHVRLAQEAEGESSEQKKEKAAEKRPFCLTYFAETG
jgi:hypothetical protein